MQPLELRIGQYNAHVVYLTLPHYNGSKLHQEQPELGFKGEWEYWFQVTDLAVTVLEDSELE